VPPDRELLRLAVPLRVPAADDGDDVARRRRDGKSDPEAVGRAHDDDAPGGGDPGDSSGEARDDAIEEKDPSNSSGKITRGALPFRWITFMLIVNKMR